MCSEHVLLMVPRRCGTNVLGLWDCGGALLGSVEEQRSLHFQSTVRRSAPCTMSCWPQSCEHSPCSSTHPVTSDRALALSGCAHSSAHIQDLELPLVLCAQVGSEATDPFLCGANAVSMLQVRPGAASFAMLEVLSAVAYTRAVQGGGLLGRFARARAPMNDCLAQSVSWTGHVHVNRFCYYDFRARAR